MGIKEELAEKLREKRKASGLGLEQVVEKTKLHPSVIKDLESGHWEDISPIYLKGFLKIYCAFFNENFDPRDLEDELKSEPAARGREKELQNIKPPSIKKNKKLPLPVIKGLLIIPAALVFLFLVFIFIGKVRNLIMSGKESVPAEEVKVEPAYRSSQEVPAPVSGPLRVSLTTRRDCFVRVRLDGRIVFEGVLKRGIVEKWEAGKEIEFKLSDGSAVDLELNGKLLPQLTKMRRPIKSVKITPAGVSVNK